MPWHLRAWKEFAQRHNLEMGHDFLHKVSHGTLYDIMPRLFGPALSREDIYRLGMEKEQIFKEFYKGNVTPLDGLLDWLKQLRDADKAIGLATAADQGNAQFTLEALKLKGFFDVVVTSDEVKEGKPSPAVYFYAAAAMGVQPQNCLVFEDTTSGVQAARAAGMHVVGITTGVNADALIAQGAVRAIAHYRGLNINGFVPLFAEV